MDISREIKIPDLVSKIEAAFSAVRLGNGTTLNQARMLDDYASKEALDAAALHDHENGWQGIDASKLEAFSDALPFMNPPGLRFHLPAFMRRVLTTWTDGRTDSECTAIVSILSGGPHSIFTSEVTDVIELYTSEQLRVIATFLEFVSRSNDSVAEDASWGLSSGWNTYLAEFF